MKRPHPKSKRYTRRQWRAWCSKRGKHDAVFQKWCALLARVNPSYTHTPEFTRISTWRDHSLDGTGRGMLGSRGAQ